MHHKLNHVDVKVATVTKTTPTPTTITYLRQKEIAYVWKKNTAIGNERKRWGEGTTLLQNNKIKR